MNAFKTLRAAGALLVFAFALSSIGCVNAPLKQSYNREANAAVKRISVLPMPESEISLLIVNNPGYNFGLVGMLVAEANLAPKRDWLRNEVSKEKFDHIAVFRDRFTQALEAKGDTLLWPNSVIEDPKAKASRDAWGMRKTYASASDADAQLDIAFGFTGYAAAGSSKSSPYRPTVFLTARLLSSDGKRILMAERIVYNQVMKGSDTEITINPDPHYAYADFDALKAGDRDVVTGLRQAFESVADELAKQL